MSAMSDVAKAFALVGSASSSSLETTFCWRTFCVSTSGRRAGHRDGLLERADLHVGVHRRGEPRRQLDAFPPDRAEAGSVKVTT